MFALLLASLVFFCARCLAAKSPTANPNFIRDPLNSPTHGVVFSSNHVVLKVDCPGCPVFNKEWHTEATSLIFDFTLTADPKDPTKPTILLNDDSFYPKPRELGWTGFTAHTVRPVPYTTTLEDYLASPTLHPPTSLVALVSPLNVNNTHAFNLTAILLLTVAYGTDDNNNHNTTFENFNGNVSAIQLFVRSQAFWSETHDHNGTVTHAGVREYWTLEWWQIVPFPLLYNRTVDTESNPPSMAMPDALLFKLLGSSAGAALRCVGGGSSCDELQPALRDLLGWVHFLGAVLIVAIVVGVFAGGWWAFGERVREMKVWEDVRGWWDESVKKMKGEGGGDGENAPLLAGGED